MKLLLDTQILFWWVTDDARLSEPARTAIRTSFGEVHVSIATAWEIAIKVGSGKWPEAAELIENFEVEIAAEQFLLEPITVGHVRSAGLLANAHRDPFDRLLVAQAMAAGMTLVASDKKLLGFAIPVVW